MARLMIRPGAIGDFIVSLPAMQFLADRDTEVWTSSANLALARFADRARSIPSVGLDRIGVTHAEDVVERLRKFDSIHSWYGAGNPAFRGFVEALALPFTFHTALPQGNEHAVDFYLKQVGAPLGATPHIECRMNRPADLAILHPFASSFSKRWPMQNFRALSEMLEPSMAVRWCRGPEEELEGAFFQENLYELGSSIATASFYIGNDSGISHLAAAVGTRTIALFGPTDPAVWAPRGKNVTVMDMDATPAEVFRMLTSQ